MTPAKAKWFQCIPPQGLVDNTSWVSYVIDTIGFEFLEILAMLGALDAALTTFKVQEADAITDDHTLTSGADVTGLVFGTSKNSAGSTSSLPAATDDNDNFLFNINLKGRKRYLQLQATIADGSAGGYLAAVARLSRAEVAPSDATGMGCNQVLQSPAFS